MNKKLLWALLAVAVVVIVILALVLPGAGSKETTAEPESTPAETVEEEAAALVSQPEAEAEKDAFPLEDGELPVDMTQSLPTSTSGSVQPAQTAQPSQTAEGGESNTSVDPETGIILEEDELPLDLAP